MSEWQPIETAPKDGQGVILWTNYGGGHMLFGARYSPERSRWEEWAIDYFDRMDWVGIEGKATHWMPLPEPPA